MGWLSALGEMEALVSLGTYAFENPQDPFPVLEETGPLFDAQALGHPLLARSRAVCNDIRLDAQRQMLVVTGSNMSGKSTFLRTVGTNAVLAQAGAPVRARALRLSPLAVGASIRVTDSLQDGESRFYAEIKRVRRCSTWRRDAAAGALPAGRDLRRDELGRAARRGRAVVRSLLGRGAMPRDLARLALAEIAVSSPRAPKRALQRPPEGDRIAFDYRLKPGPCSAATRSADAGGRARGLGARRRWAGTWTTRSGPAGGTRTPPPAASPSARGQAALVRRHLEVDAGPLRVVLTAAHAHQTNGGGHVIVTGVAPSLATLGGSRQGDPLPPVGGPPVAELRCSTPDAAVVAGLLDSRIERSDGTSRTSPAGCASKRACSGDP